MYSVELKRTFVIYILYVAKQTVFGPFWVPCSNWNSYLRKHSEGLTFKGVNTKVKTITVCSCSGSNVKYCSAESPFNVNRNFTRVLVVVKLATNCTCTECKERKTKVLLVAFFFCSEKWVINSIFDNRLRVVPHFSSGIVERAKRVGWFSRALAFRTLYYPWGKMGDYSKSNLTNKRFGVTKQLIVKVKVKIEIWLTWRL